MEITLENESPKLKRVKIAFLRRYQGLLIFSILFFYLGSRIAISLTRTNCVSSPNIRTFSKAEAIKNHALYRIEYAVLILSSPDNEMERDSVRATWATFTNNIFVKNGKTLYTWNYTWNKSGLKQFDIIKIYFAIGTQNLNNSKLTKLALEHSITNDLLLLDNHEDTYSTLASKMLHALKWMSNNLKELKYVIKCDDDSFVRIDLIVRELEHFAPRMNGQSIDKYVSRMRSMAVYKGLYWGYFEGKSKVYRGGKFQERKWFLCNKYLPYAHGGGYVISRSIVDYVAKNADVLSCYNSEDVSMGVWTAALNGINRVHDIRFDTLWNSQGCEDSVLVRHKQTPSDMLEMFATLAKSNGTKLCKTNKTTRKIYIYNWNVLPSSCCLKPRNIEEL